MSRTETIAALLAAGQAAAAEQAREAARIAARYRWGMATIAAYKATQKRADEAWMRLFDAMPDDLPDEAYEAVPEPPEQAEVDRLYELLAAMRDHDRWPKHLYWSL